MFSSPANRYIPSCTRKCNTESLKKERFIFIWYALEDFVNTCREIKLVIVRAKKKSEKEGGGEGKEDGSIINFHLVFPSLFLTKVDIIQ